VPQEPNTLTPQREQAGKSLLSINDLAFRCSEEY